MTTHYPKILAALAAACCAACAPLAPLHDVDWQHGARYGWVSAFYDGATPRAALPACLAALPPEELAAHRYVQIAYRHVRVMRNEVAPLPELPGGPLQMGEHVELWPQDCDQGKLSRIAKRMPPAA